MKTLDSLRVVALVSVLALSACAESSYDPPADIGGPVDFTIDGLSFHISSGGFIRSGQQFTIFFTDQPNACTAVLLIPQQIFLSLMLKVSPPADATTTATIGAPSPVVFPPNGKAGGAALQAGAVQTPPFQLRHAGGGLLRRNGHLAVECRRHHHGGAARHGLRRDHRPAGDAATCTIPPCN